MREYSVPAAVTDSPHRNFNDVIVGHAEQDPKAVLFRRKVGDDWTPVTAEAFRQEVVAVAKGLVAAGIEPGQRIGLMSRTQYEWTLCDFAIWYAGAVTVPIYETSSAEQVEWILGDSEAAGCFVETPIHQQTVASVQDKLGGLKHVWRFSSDLKSLIAAGADVDDAEIEKRRTLADRDTMATLIYTSGTTGRPKGVELSHGNFLFEVEAVTADAAEVFKAGESTLLFLPLAHVFARVIQLGCVFAKVEMGHSPDVKDLLTDLAEFQPSFVLSVPRVFEKIFNNASQKAHAAGKGRIFDTAAATAISYSQAHDNAGPGPLLRARHLLFDRLVYSKLREALGGRVRYAVSGGAPLGERLGHFFRGAGIEVLEGYGLTETAAASTVNRPGASRVGTVGRPIAGSGVKIADDGEVLLKGPHVFAGYWHNDTATREALESDGWFHTGDIGELDADGFLRITGRKKELIVTAGGKNVAPAVLEDRIRAHWLVSQCMVVGDAQPYIAALITLDPEAFEDWKKQEGKSGTLAELAEDPDLRAAVQVAVNEGNAAVSKAEAIKRFRILATDFTEDTGHLTPTMKLKRNVVAKDFAADIDALYS